MKTSLLATLLALVALLATSCSSQKSADASDLLATVPSDVSMVSVVNLQSILDKAGCKIDGDKVKPSKDFEKAIGQIANAPLREFMEVFTTGESGVDASIGILFCEGYNVFFTGIASDPGNLKTIYEKGGNPAFVKEKGIEISGRMAIAGNQFWLCLTKNIDIDDVRHFTTIDRTQSFLENENSERLLTISKDIEGWGNISGMMNVADLGFEERAKLQIALQILFDDPSSVIFSLESDKGEFEIEARVLNSKNKTAKYLLPTDKVDVETVKVLGCDADMLYALAVPQQMIAKLKKDTSSKGISLLGAYLEPLGCLDGTLAVAGSPLEGKMILTTTGQNTAGLIDMAQSIAGIEFKKDGKLLVSQSGSPRGALSAEKEASEFKNAMGGFIMKNNGISWLPRAIDTFSVMLYSEDGGIEVKAEAKTADEKKNAMLSLLETL